jgi:HK97 gp10 family phage protein
METVQIKGLRELRQALTKTIPFEMQGKVLQKALAAGTALTVAAAKARAPTLTGRLKRAIYATRDKKGSKPTFESRAVTVRRGKKQQKSDRDAFYWKFVEFGHRIVSRKGDESTRSARKRAGGSVPPHPFMRPAFESTKQAAAAAITEKLKSLLDAAVRKARF